MKKIGDHMKDLGFNENASVDAKKAFIKYLMREAQFHDRVTDLYKFKQDTIMVEENKENAGEQLSLFDQTGTE